MRLTMALRAAAVSLGLSLVACSDCTEEIEAARAFLKGNRSCQSNEDCVAVSTGCHTFKNGLCAQAPLNRSAAATRHWQRLSQDLKGCENECVTCTAALIPECTAGVCGGSP